MKCRQLAAWLVLLSIAAAGCGSATKDATRRTNTTPRSAAESRQAAGARTPKPRKGPKLQGKFRNLAAGDGAAPDCKRDLSSLPAGFATSPAVWMSTIQGPSNLVLNRENALCLHGFMAERAVTVTVTDGRHDYTATAQPTAGALTFDQYEPPESLFNGARLRVYDIGDSVMQSETWDFVPQSAARESLAAAGHITITATQGSTTASYTQSVAVPTNPERARLRGESKRRLVVDGFKQGDTIPIGLYRLATGSDQATLVRQLGSVVMPLSRTAVFAVPQSAAGSKYCVTVPLPEQYNCPSF